MASESISGRISLIEDFCRHVSLETNPALVLLKEGIPVYNESEEKKVSLVFYRCICCNRERFKKEGSTEEHARLNWTHIALGESFWFCEGCSEDWECFWEDMNIKEKQGEMELFWSKVIRDISTIKLYRKPETPENISFVLES